MNAKAKRRRSSSLKKEFNMLKKEIHAETKDEVAKTLETSEKDLQAYNDLLNSKIKKLSLELSSHNNSSPSADNNDNDSDSCSINSTNSNDDLPPECKTIMNNCVKQAKELELLESEIEKSKKDFSTLLEIKGRIEHSLEIKENEYLERIKECEAITESQTGMIDSMEGLLKDLVGKMDRLKDEKARRLLPQRPQSTLSNYYSHDAASIQRSKSSLNNHYTYDPAKVSNLQRSKSSLNNHYTYDSAATSNIQRTKSSLSNHYLHEPTKMSNAQRSKSSLSNHSLDPTNTSNMQRSKSSLSNHYVNDTTKKSRTKSSLSNINTNIFGTIMTSLKRSQSKESNCNYSNYSSSDEYNPSELMPARCISPPRSRRQSYTNPISLFTDEERVKHQSRFVLAKRWVEDDEVSVCRHADCNTKFSFWNRKHHCRRCGDIFCYKHSNYSMLLFADGNEDWGGVWSKVCEECYKDKDDKKQ
ncbi:9744_t:CDS:2 [Entrophospora sp. SA101]|nr:9740_t:CDS:2 [Entrophospora sp. SA101]CAJ0915849.1 9744_t:CDS:2 [Entrophospora sp. SA101]